jgi:hypothetical protein
MKLPGEKRTRKERSSAFISIPCGWIFGLAMVHRALLLLAIIFSVTLVHVDASRPVKVILLSVQILYEETVTDTGCMRQYKRASGHIVAVPDGVDPPKGAISIPKGIKMKASDLMKATKEVSVNECGHDESPWYKCSWSSPALLLTQSVFSLGKTHGQGSRCTDRQDRTREGKKDHDS